MGGKKKKQLKFAMKKVKDIFLYLRSAFHRLMLPD